MAMPEMDKVTQSNVANAEEISDEGLADESRGGRTGGHGGRQP